MKPKLLDLFCGAWKGAYGLEATPEMYVEHTIEILREVRRVLRKDGVVFWNIGDSYSGGNRVSDKAQTLAGNNERDLPIESRPSRTMGIHLTIKPKDLCLIPFRVAIAAQSDGWYVRSVIIWSKPNPMPESVTDRPTESHEYILMLTKSARYYWDADAVRERQKSADRSQFYDPDDRPTDEEIAEKIGQFANSRKRDEGGRFTDQGKEATNPRDGYQGQLRKERPPRLLNPAGGNLRSVWEFPTQPYPGAHFAVFPEKLPELCIKAATPEVGCCSKCGAPWERIVEKTGHINKREPAHVLGNTTSKTDSIGWAPVAMGMDKWQPTCKCNADKTPSIVLDPFMGAGTTLWVAKKLNRKAIGYEISEEYCKLAFERLRQQVML